MRTPLRFDVSSLPAGATIQSATISLWISGKDDSGDPINVHRVTQDWSESGATWQNAASDYDATIRAQFVPDESDRFFSFGIASLVQAWVDGTASNFGIMLIPTSNGVEAKFASSEWSPSSQRPCMDVTYTQATPDPHFQIAHSDTGTTCDASEIVIRRHTSGDATDGSYAGSITVSTSTGQGTWSLVEGLGTFDDTGGGTSTYTFSPGDGGEVVLGLGHGVEATVDIDVTDGTYVESPDEDDPIVFSAPGSGTVRDEFDAYSYSGNNGTSNWSGAWSEVGESNGSSYLFVGVSAMRCVSSACLRIGTSSSYRQSFTQRGAKREVDLSGATTATLRFSYLRGYASGSGTAWVQVSSDGGANFTTLASYTLNGNTTTPIPQSFDISSYISSNTQIRFIATVSYSTTSIYIDNIEVEYDSACSTNDYFALSHDGSGVHCQGESFDVQAMANGDSVLTNYAQQVTLTTSAGLGTFASDAGNFGTFSEGTANDGRATYQFVAADAGSARFSLSYSGSPSGGGSSDTLDIDVYESAQPGVADDDREGLLSYSPAGLVMTAHALANPPPNPVNDPLVNQRAGDRLPGPHRRLWHELLRSGVRNHRVLCRTEEPFLLAGATRPHDRKRGPGDRRHRDRVLFCERDDASHHIHERAGIDLHPIQGRRSPANTSRGSRGVLFLRNPIGWLECLRQLPRRSRNHADRAPGWHAESGQRSPRWRSIRRRRRAVSSNRSRRRLHGRTDPQFREGSDARGHPPSIDCADRPRRRTQRNAGRRRDRERHGFHRGRAARQFQCDLALLRRGRRDHPPRLDRRRGLPRGG